MHCPKCGSPSLIKHGKQWRFKKVKDIKSRGAKSWGFKIQRYRCNSCGHFTVYPAEDKS